MSTKQKDTQDLFSHKYYKLCYLANLLIRAYILRLLNELEIPDFLPKIPSNVLRIIRYLEFDVQAEKPLEWMLRFAEESPLISQVEEVDTLELGLFSNDSDIHVIENNMLELDNNIAIFCELTKRVFEEYPKFFKGKKGAEILFSNDGIRLWEQYFSSKNSGYQVYNSFGASCLSKWLKSDKGKFLELGAGVGSATITLFNLLCNLAKTDLIEEYVYSDISPALLRLGSQNLVKEKLVDTLHISFKKFNFNEEFSGQDVGRESLAVVYGVNSLHAAKDLFFTLKEINQSLKSGGMLIISECVRSEENKLPFQEVIFNMLDDYRDVKLDPVYRPTYGFLYSTHWGKLLEASGFYNIEVVSNNKGARLTNRPELAMVIKGEKP